LLDFEPLGNVTLLHLTDTHATLRPVYFREPDTLLGVGAERGHPPYLTGEALLAAYGIPRGSPTAYALTYLDFPTLAARLRAHGRLRSSRHAGEPRARRALGQDAPARRGRRAAGLGHRAVEPRRGHAARDEPARRRGVHAHWEFIYGLERMRELFGDRETRGRFSGEFLAQNVTEAGWGDRVFTPATVREVGGVRVGVIGQAFPYTPIAHPAALRARPHVRHPGGRGAGAGARAA